MIAPLIYVAFIKYTYDDIGETLIRRSKDAEAELVLKKEVINNNILLFANGVSNLLFAKPF